MTTKGTIRQALSLWLSPNPEDDLDQILQSFAIARQALDDMLDGKITLQTYIEIASACGVNVDEYLETSNENLRFLL